MGCRAFGQVSFLSLVFIWAGGCAYSGTPLISERDRSVTASEPIATPQTSSTNQHRQISLASWETTSPNMGSTSTTEAFRSAKELTVEMLVEQVLARNPSLAEMEAAWQAASARYPQAVSLDDPM